uniref:ABC-ATPase domain-containing protein n=1 Tax=Staphylococcus epidermidis TaxID=1282 RepID=UPI001C92D0AC
FSTQNPTRTTSQPPNLIQPLQSQPSFLLIHQHTSPTNFMIPHPPIQPLIPPQKHPITPFSNNLKPLYHHHNLSTILILAPSTHYFHLPHQVFIIHQYLLKH